MWDTYRGIYHYGQTPRIFWAVTPCPSSTTLDMVPRYSMGLDDDETAASSGSPMMKPKRMSSCRSQVVALLLQFDFTDWPEADTCCYHGVQFFICVSRRSIRDRTFSEAAGDWDQD